MFCKKCGKEINDDALICPNCGAGTDNYASQQTTHQTAPTTATQTITPPITIINTNTNTNTNNNAGALQKPKSKMTALILCLIGFLGIGGLHCFYVGKAGMGILYILTMGLFGIGTIVDLIRIATGSYKDSFGQPLA